jgi:N-acylglucosamine-6-phosphate 2-epimerase
VTAEPAPTSTQRPIDPVKAIGGGLVVSCQAMHGHPLRDSDVIGRLAECAELGGAVGLRVNGPEDVASVRARTRLPVIGLHKVWNGHRNLITPALDYARGVHAAGADLIAIDFTAETPGAPGDLVAAIHDELGLPVIADVSSNDEGLAAWDAGADLVGTTLSGYTRQHHVMKRVGPDLQLVKKLADAGVRVVGEGRYTTQDDVRRAFDAGAWAVVVGTAITDPIQITKRLVSVTPSLAFQAGT